MNIGIPQVSVAGKRFGRFFAESWCEKWDFNAAKDCFFSRAHLEGLRVARRQTVDQHFAECEFADPTNTSARVEKVEIKSINLPPSLLTSAFRTMQRDVSPTWMILHKFWKHWLWALSTTAKTHVLDRTWVGFIGTTFCSSAAENWEMWRWTWFDSWIA